MTSNNLGSIYATTISSEKYIIIDSQNIELSGNVIISNSSIITNSIIPNITNNESLGTSSKIWSNAYIHDVSINNNIEISGNTIINGVLQAPNIYTNALQVSGNATISGSTLYVPSSFTIDPNGHGDNTGTLLINGNLVVQGVTTTINSSVVDISDKMLVLASNASNSFEANGAGFEISGAKVKFLYDNTSTTFNSSIGMSISGNVVPVTNSVGSLGESGKIWDIAYIRELNVTNFTNSIDGAKIANETITSTQIMNGSILTTDICDNAITFDKLAYNSVGNTRIINGAVTHEKLSSNCIQSHNIVDGTIVDADISGNANILGSKLANNSITSDKINQANNWTFSQLTSTRANIRDISASNIEVSGNIMPLRDISSNLGSSLNRWNYIYVNDLSVNTINGQAYSAGGGASGDISINGIINISEPSETVSRFIQLGRDLDGEYAHNGAFTGWSVSLNSEGNIVAIGARRNEGDAVWPYGAGNVKIYKYIDASWIQLGEDINGNIPNQQSGFSVSLNNAGNIVAIGSPYFTANGLVKLYIYNDVSWVQLGSTIVGEALYDCLGVSVVLNGIGDIVAIYAPSADGVNGANTGHTRIYKYSNNDWVQLGQDIDGTLQFEASPENDSNTYISLNTLGNIVAIGNYRANQYIGEVKVFKYSVNSWIQLGNTISGEGDYFGFSVSLNSTGYILAASATHNSGANGIQSGSVRIYKYNDISWIQLGSDIDGEEENNLSGHSVSLNDDGTIVAIGARENRGAASNSISSSFGHVRVYKYNGISWVQYGIDIDGEAAGDKFGHSVSLNSAGNILAVGAPYNDGTRGTSYPNSGSVRVYKFYDILVENKVNSGNIAPFTNNTYTLGTSSLEWKSANIKELNVNSINISKDILFNVSGGNILNINKLSSTSNNSIIATTRVYQEISNNSNWNAVNGYYGLAKQSFPALNPLSCGAKAIAYWTSRQSGGNADFRSIIWAPKLRMFLTFPDLITPTNNIFAKYSYDGINWINISINVAVYIKCICWSEELGIFVAGSFRHPFAIYSYNGIEWFTDTTRDSDISFFSICWSPELGIFVAVTDNINSTYKACTSIDGINWIGATTTANQLIKWGSVCWAPELGLFVATNNEYNNTNTKVMTSNDGYNWTLRTVPSAAEYPNWGSVCWSPQLGIFVTVAWNGAGPTTANIMTSTNGIDWIIRRYNDGYNPAYRSVCWCAELGIFLITQTTGEGSYLYSRNGTVWIEYENISENGEYSSFNGYSVARSPELGIFVAVGGNKIWTSVLKGRIPTISNVFDSSFNKIDENGKWTFGAIDVSGALNVMGDVNAPNLYTKTEVDISFVSKEIFDASLSSIQLTNVYTKTEVDISFVSKEIFDASLSSIQLTNVYTKTEVDVSFVSKELFDASINALASGGGGGGGGSTDLTSITSNVVPSTTNTYNLGSTSSYWSNAYINNLKVSNRVYQEISGDISWSAVNGHYGLAKDAYPSLNPVSSGANAVMSWRTITTNSTISNSEWAAVCWSPELRLFVAVGRKNTGSSVVITSNNGITWTPVPITDTSITLGFWTAVCWSPQLRLFVAGGEHIGGTSLRFMYSSNGTTWNPLPDAPSGRNVYNIRWSPELGIFLAIAQGAIITSSDGYTWIENYMPHPLNNSNWEDACWSPELGLFVAVAYNEIKVMISKNGINWTRVDIPASVFGGQWCSITWSSQLGIFVAVSKYTGGTTARVMTSRDAITWILADIPEEAQHTWASVCWSPELRIFIGTLLSAWDGSYRILTSVNGTNWKFVPVGTPLISDTLKKVIWCPELGIFIALKGSTGNDQINISSLRGRPPTSYNVFDSSFNSIDETGKWTFQNLGVTGTFTNTSDDRLKHNEIVISNGLAIIDSLTPKFYQKTLTMLDSSYNGDLSGQAWTYEAGVIAQELLQISDLSFVVSGGNYYQERYIYSRPTNDPSNANYDPSLNIYDISNANYTISNTLITQTYSVNYNSVFVYGLAAIKELHTKVKAQETSISSLQTALLEQQATINSVLTRLQALETSAN